MLSQLLHLGIAKRVRGVYGHCAGAARSVRCVVRECLRTAGLVDPKSSRDITFSSEDASGHARIDPDNGNITVYLPTLTPYLRVSREEFPFNTVEDILEDIIVHELLHEATGYERGLSLDTWHMLLCRIESSHLAEAKTCSCPIDCYLRDSMTDHEHSPDTTMQQLNEPR